MTDVLTPSQRSRCMSRIRARDTEPEVLLRKILWKKGLRYRLGSNLEGHPDLVFPRYRTVVFVDGCFWHRCPKHAVRPKNNAIFWNKKLEANVARDKRVARKLRDLGWRVFRVWEHEVRNDATQAAERLFKKMFQSRKRAE